jgi:predicted DNA-binding ribbon-helix-helix protein
MKSGIAKRSIVIDGHKTSVSLEDAFWSTLKDIAQERGETLSQLVAAIDRQRDQATCAAVTEATSGSVSHITRLRPPRLAA